MIPGTQIDTDKQTTPSPTALNPERNQREVRCGMCARAVYVDEQQYRFVSDAIEAGLDNPFRCEICAEEYDDLAYEG